MANKPIPVANFEALVQAEKQSHLSLLVSARSSGTNGNRCEMGVSGDGVNQMIEMIESIGSYQGFRRTQRKECFKLVRRLKLLLPLLEEIKDAQAQTLILPPQHLNCLDELQKPLRSAKKLLKQCNRGSKIYLALESEAVLSQFLAVYDKLNQALDCMPYQELGVSVEVKEQVELMRTQLKRAKRRTDTQDMELAMDMMVVFSKHDDRNADSAILQRLAINLELHTVADLKAETIAVENLISKRDSQNSESNQQILDLLRKFKEVAGVDDDLLLSPTSSRNLQRCHSSLTPNEFLCPITLEIMTDPVITATGQTYERESIQRWLDSNHRTCPKTGQALDHTVLAPNVALKNLIHQWCERNNYDLPKKTPYVGPSVSFGDMQEEISSTVKSLSSSDRDKLREAVLKIRLLSRENPDNRILIANNGGLQPLVRLLTYPDPDLQEQTVTSLLNLSINETNKRLIAREGAIPAIIEILQNGTEKARENSAAALFSLAMLDENKALVGNLNGIPPLVKLLQCGTVRGKKDAATALFNLCLNQTNKLRAIEAGIIPRLLLMLEDKNLGMVDEALSILNLLASHPEGRNEIGKLSFIETLVGIIGSGTPKNKECATAVLLELGTNNSSFILAALQYGVYEHLVDLTRNGTNRAQRKANSLLQLMTKCEHIP